MSTNQVGLILLALGFICTTVAAGAYDVRLSGILGGVMIFITGLLFGASDD